jgi:hypothetical protein
VRERGQDKPARFKSEGAKFQRSDSHAMLDELCLILFESRHTGDADGFCRKWEQKTI